MLSVIKQELFIHKKNILIMSVLIIGLYVGCGIFGGLNKVFVSETITEISALWFSFSMIIGTFGAFFVALIAGALNQYGAPKRFWQKFINFKFVSIFLYLL